MASSCRLIGMGNKLQIRGIVFGPGMKSPWGPKLRMDLFVIGIYSARGNFGDVMIFLNGHSFSCL